MRRVVSCLEKFPFLFINILEWTFIRIYVPNMYIPFQFFLLVAGKKRRDDSYMHYFVRRASGLVHL